MVKKVSEVPAPPKETERQLSKKERKKKELEELDALLADLGVQSNNGQGIFSLLVHLSKVIYMASFASERRKEIGKSGCKSSWLICVKLTMSPSYSILFVPLTLQHFYF